MLKVNLAKATIETVIKTWLEAKKGLIMNIKKAIVAKEEVDAHLKSLKNDEVVQVISTSGDTPTVGVLITQEHYMSLLEAQNSPANILNKEVAGKVKEFSAIVEKGAKVLSAIIDDKKPKQ